MFQSLLHQGISLLRTPRRALAAPFRWGFNPFFIRASVYCRGQGRPRGGRRGRRFNPFFIRASVYWRQTACLGICPRSGFNPFFIRASVYWLRRAFARPCSRNSFQSLLHQGISLLQIIPVDCHQTCFFVSIPSSSGHQFTGIPLINIAPRKIRSFNPFFIRASVYCSGNPYEWNVKLVFPFQSLLHQGISLLARNASQTAAGQGCSVSIPSSSGHQFTASASSRPSTPAMRLVSIPSSSGHQFTGVLSPCRKPPSGPRFNPFFIRASVYCGRLHPPPPEGDDGGGFNPFFIRASVY